MPTYDYTTTQYFSRTITRAGGTSADFTGFSRTGYFSRYRPEVTSTRIGTYAQSYFNPQGEPNILFYATSYTGDFVGNFTRTTYGYFSRTSVEDYTGYYSRAFIGNYSRDFVGTYSRSSTGVFTGTFTRSYSRNFTRDYTITSTRTSTYTRTISGGSGEAPTYTASSGSDAEYGLVVYGPDGTTEIINPTTRVINLAFYGTVAVNANSSATVTIEDVGDPSKVTVSLVVFYEGINLTTSGNTLTVTNTRNYNVSPTLIAIRI